MIPLGAQALPHKLDDRVVHPAYGLCRIQGIERRNFNGSSEECYILMIGHGGTQAEVTIPLRQAAAAGIRPPVTSDEALQLINILRGKDPAAGRMLLASWDDVEQGLRSGNPFEMASILRQLAVAEIEEWEELTREPLRDNRRSKKSWVAAAVHRLASELAFAQQVPISLMKERFRQWLEADQGSRAKNRSLR